MPAGILPLVDPDRQPSAESDGTPGGIVEVDNEPFLPLPVNERQLQIIRKVDSSAQVLVQGPPGTGKTHTAAALLSHLLAQGKRVLVTAQTDRALIEVRGKLPHTIKPLSVSVVGSSRSDMSDLKFAVEQISSRASAHDPAEAERDIAGTLQRSMNSVESGPPCSASWSRPAPRKRLSTRSTATRAPWRRSPRRTKQLLTSTDAIHDHGKRRSGLRAPTDRRRDPRAPRLCP